MARRRGMSLSLGWRFARWAERGKELTSAALAVCGGPCIGDRAGAGQSRGAGAFPDVSWQVSGRRALGDGGVFGLVLRFSKLESAAGFLSGGRFQLGGGVLAALSSGLDQRDPWLPAGALDFGIAFPPVGPGGLCGRSWTGLAWGQGIAGARKAISFEPRG